MKLWHIAALAVGGYLLFKDSFIPQVFTLQPFQRYLLSGVDTKAPSIKREMSYISPIGIGQTETIIIGQTVKTDIIGSFSILVQNVKPQGGLFG
jgi:hypothetical protein